MVGPLVTDLTTLQLVQDYLSTANPPNQSTEILQELISAVSVWISTYCDDPFFSATYDQFFSGWGSTSMPLPYGPVTAINFVNVDGVSIPARPPLTGPTINAWGYSYNAREQVVRLTGYRFWRGDNNIEINYTAGFANQAALPIDLVFAATKLTAWHFRARQGTGKTSDSIGGKQSTSWARGMSDDIKDILDHYRRLGLGL